MKIQGRFVGCLQDAQELGSDEQFMISRVEFEIGGQHTGHMTIKQPAGGNYETDPLEVSPPHEYAGPNVDYQQLRDLAEHYYRSLVGSGGRAIRIGSGARNVRMRDNYFAVELRFQIDAHAGAAGGW